MKKTILALLLLIAFQLINAQIDKNKIIDIYWESVKAENNETIITFKETEKSYLVFHKNGFFSFVFSIDDLKKTTQDKWKFDEKTQSFILNDASGNDPERMIFKVISVSESELVVKPNFSKNINKLFFRRLTKYK